MLGIARKCDGHGRKVYVDTSTSYVSEAVNKLIEKVRKFVRLSRLHDLQVTYEATESNCENTKKPEGPTSTGAGCTCSSVIICKSYLSNC